MGRPGRSTPAAVRGRSACRARGAVPWRGRRPRAGPLRSASQARPRVTASGPDSHQRRQYPYELSIPGRPCARSRGLTAADAESCVASIAAWIIGHRSLASPRSVSKMYKESAFERIVDVMYGSETAYGRLADSGTFNGHFFFGAEAPQTCARDRRRAGDDRVAQDGHRSRRVRSAYGADWDPRRGNLQAVAP